MFATILRHPLIVYVVVALFGLAVSEYEHRRERMRAARDEIARRARANWLRIVTARTTAGRVNFEKRESR